MEQMFTNLNGNRMDIRVEGTGDKELVTAHTHKSGPGAAFRPSNCPEMGPWWTEAVSMAGDIDS